MLTGFYASLGGGTAEAATGAGEATDEDGMNIYDFSSPRLIFNVRDLSLDLM